FACGADAFVYLRPLRGQVDLLKTKSARAYIQRPRSVLLETYVSASPGHFSWIHRLHLPHPAVLVRGRLALDWLDSAQQLKKRPPNFVVRSVADDACRLSRSHARPRAFQDCRRKVDHRCYANLACGLVFRILRCEASGNHRLDFRSGRNAPLLETDCV